jgi:hypothetical protein
MGFGKKIIDFIAPPIKQKVPKQETQTLDNTEQETPKKKQKIGVQEVEEPEYEILESNVQASTENSTEIPELEVEEYVVKKDSQVYLETEPVQESILEDTQNHIESLSYQEYEETTKDIEFNAHETKNELDIIVENITSQSIAEIPVIEEEISELSSDIYSSHLPDTNFLQDEPEYFTPFYPENSLFENSALTYFENPVLVEHLEENKFLFSPLDELAQNTKETTQQIDIDDFNHVQNLPTEKFIFSDNKKSITLPIHTSMQTELSNPIDYQPTDIQKITESISLEAPAMNALLKNAVRTIMQRKGIQEITAETLPLIKDDLSLVLEASGSNLSTMVGDVLQIKKIVNDKVNERRDKVNEYKSELTQKISQLLTQVRHLEGEVGKLDNIIYTDIEELTKINKTLDTYQMLLASISEQKFNFE